MQLKGCWYTWDYLDYMVNVVQPRQILLTKSLWSTGMSDEETDLKVAQFDGRTDNDIGIFPQCFCSDVPLLHQIKLLIFM